MSPLDSASTLDAIRAAYADNASFHEDHSIAKARAFVTACRLLLLHLPKRAMKGGGAGAEEIELDPGLLLRQIDEAKQFITEYHCAESPRRTFSLEGFRD